jgi:enoyl-CoA hydratase/carnithine racemase
MARELALFGLALSAPDRVEGVRAFRERRRPEFDW